MMRALDPDFPLRSALAVRAPRDVTIEEQRLGLEDELERRMRTYPGHVSRNAMTQADADRQIALCRVLVDDARRIEWHRARAIAADRGQPAPIEPRGHPHSFGWEDRVRELRRDIAIRRNAYPRWIASATNPMTAEKAAIAFDWLDAVHYRYAIDLDCFTGPDLAPADDHARIAWIATTEQQDRNQQWNAALGAGGVHRRRLAWQDRRHWQRVASIAEYLAAGHPLLSVAGQTMLDQLIEHSVRIYEATIRATNAGDRPPQILDWHMIVDRWLMKLRGSLVVNRKQPSTL